MKAQPSSGGLGADRRSDRTPLPTTPGRTPDPRLVDVWCAFLGRLATDAEAALAAAMAYRELDAQAREIWIGALEQDIERVQVPRIAVYAPLLAVETDPKRRARVLAAIGPAQVEATPRSPAFALAGNCGREECVAAIVLPLYLDFVQVLACGYRSGERFDWVKHDPIVERTRAPLAGSTLNGAKLEPIPMKAIVDDLAMTVVAHNRTGEPVPEALRIFADLFGPSGDSSPRALHLT